VQRASRAYQLESSDGAAGMQGVESAALGAETTEESARTAVDGTDTATAAGHNLLSGLLDGTGPPAVR
jgi:2-succinyl-5-enolpyruvyl-6-hydroxy-3-cyclohexene-1-carboxylate synthase